MEIDLSREKVMARSLGSSISQAEMYAWIKTNQEQIEKHPAWRGNVDAMLAETLLKKEASFTYLLRKGEKEQAYYISFVKEDGGIKHQRFTLEYGLKGWYYKNGVLKGPEEVIDEFLDRLIPQMMYCDSDTCRIFEQSLA